MAHQFLDSERIAGTGILATLVEIETERGDVTSAQRLLWQEREIIEHIANHANSAELRESFLDTPAGRAVLAEDRGAPSRATAGRSTREPCPILA